MQDLLSKYVIGTAQFGMNYGISNKKGRLSENDIFKILDIARKKNINYLDTAISYGDSESRLGEQDLSLFNVITKINFPKFKTPSSEFLTNQVNLSLSRLNISSLYAILLHDPAVLLSDFSDDIYSALLELKKNGQVKKIGISIYSPSILKEILARYEIDIIQCPLNIFDQRLLHESTFNFLNNKNIEIHARSIFLQGLLLMDFEDMPQYFKSWQDKFNFWKNWLHINKLAPLQACLNFIHNIKEIDKIVIGVNSYDHLLGIINATSLSPHLDTSSLAIHDESLINPSNWN